MKRRRGKEKMDGILCIDKEKDWTSRDVVNYLSHAFKEKKMGHIGTLDPFATGLLVVVYKKATKIASYLEANQKTYVASLLLGEDTDTLDLEGNVTQKKEVPSLEEKEIRNVLSSFVGEIEQEVPQYSAVKYKGKPLYDYARNQEATPEIKRKITIESISFLSYENQIITFEVTCSKGTYIRQLGQDIAHALHTCGHLISLRRTKIGNLSVENAKKVKEITLDDLISMKDALSFMEQVKVNPSLEKDIQNGKRIALVHESPLLLAINEEDEVVAILEKEDTHYYHVKRGLF